MMTAVEAIHIDSCLLLPGHPGDAVPLAAETSTVEGLLRHLGDQIGFPLIDAQGQLIGEVDVSLNGTPLSFCPAGLATRLAPDDRVGIFLVPLGGG